MNQSEIINTTVSFVQNTLEHAEGGHDWWHIYRVWQTAKHMAQYEKADLFTVELGALLHDIADAKFHDGDESIGPATATKFLQELQVPVYIIKHIANIITHISFKNNKEEQSFYSPELAIVQDADRLDALGAIGIARAFNYGGFKNRKLYDPGILPKMSSTKEEYKHNEAPTLNHFYEKLFLLKDKMNTVTGKKMAAERHQFMEAFVNQFYKEWDSEV